MIDNGIISATSIDYNVLKVRVTLEKHGTDGLLNELSLIE